MKTEATTARPGVFLEETMKNPSYQAYQVLHFAFAVAPILAGIDKFLNKLTDWSMYLWPPLGNMAGGAHRFMYGVGVIEMIAGILVAFKPKWGAPIVAAWLIGIIVNLILIQNFYDIALRDLGLCLGAVALSRLALQFDHPHHATPTQ